MLFAVNVKIEIFVLDFFIGAVRTDFLNGVVEQFHQIRIFFANGNAGTFTEIFYL